MSTQDPKSGNHEDQSQTGDSGVFSFGGMEKEGEAVSILPRIKVDYSHPMYKNDAGRDFLGDELPDGVTLSEDQLPITKPLFEDLMVCFAADKGDSYELLQNGILKHNPHLNAEVLYQASIESVIAEIGGEIQVNGDPNHIVMVTAGGNFEATLILVDDFWEQMKSFFGEKMVVAIPAKDLLLICRESNKEAISELKEGVRRLFENPDTHGVLSKGLYLKEVGKREMKLIDQAF
ncbi:MAG: DUF1444 family protein [Bacteroidia bacterium]|nr:DUF1444 family protein [Bacteroidia bacterium]